MLVVLCIGCITTNCNRRAKWPQSAPTDTTRAPMVPDLYNVTIPPNIAPLNFKISADAENYGVVLTGAHHSGLVIESNSPSILFPDKKWRDVLAKNAGNDLVLFASIRQRGGVYRTYAPCTLHVAKEPIDPFIAYRIIRPLFNWWKDVGIYFRDLRSFDEREIISGTRFENGCVNCHTFLNNDPRRFVIGVRSKKFGNACVFISGNTVFKEKSKIGYSSWHPSGKIIAFANMQVKQFFHSTRSEARDVVDMYSHLEYFDFNKNMVRKIDNLADARELQTYPAWTPDGKTMFYCAAPVLWERQDTVPPRNYANVRYSLKKISYDILADTWGKPMTVLSADGVGKSVGMPRVSPDGSFLIFCMCDYGVFPAFQKNSDLYCMDLATGNYWKLGCNSGESESWHAWSSNSRWIAFSSKRADGVFTRIYLCHIDETGKSGKPFVLPQEDPDFYGSFMKTYSVPELLIGPVSAGPEEINRAVRSMPEVDAATSATP